MAKREMNQGVVSTTIMVTGAMVMIFTAIIDSKNSKKKTIINELNSGIFEYLDRKAEREKLTDEDYLNIIGMIKDSTKEVLAEGYEKFIDMKIRHIKGEKELTT